MLKKIAILVFLVCISNSFFSEDASNINSNNISNEQSEIVESDDDLEIDDSPDIILGLENSKNKFICKFNLGPALLHYALFDIAQTSNLLFLHAPLTWQWMFNPHLSVDLVLDTFFFTEFSCDLGLTYYFSDAAPNGIYASVAIGASSGLSILSGNLFSMNGAVSVGYQYLFGKSKKWLLDAGLGASWYGGAFNNLISPNLNLGIGRVF